MSFDPRIHDGFSLAILAGGESTRMGRDKAFVPFAGGSLVEWQIRQLGGLFRHVFIVCRDPGSFAGLSVPVVRDALDARGALVGIYTAILASPTRRTLCVACDMPFVSGSFVAELCRESLGYSVCVPRHDGLLEPLCAVYSRDALPEAGLLLAAGVRKIDELFSRVPTKYLDVALGQAAVSAQLFANANTPSDLDRALVFAEAPGVAPRVRRFMQRMPVRVVAFVGAKKSGKTTLLEAVVRELVRSGRRVATIKHDFHGFHVDTPGTDSYRLQQAGAVVSGVSSEGHYAFVARIEGERSLEELVRRVGESVDYVLAEGYKKQEAPKIEVTNARSLDGLVSPLDELIAVVADGPIAGLSVPVLSRGDSSAVVRLLEEWFERAEAGRFQYSSMERPETEADSE